MNRRHVVFTGVVWLGLAGFAGFQARVVALGRDEAALLQAQQQRCDAEISALRHEQTALAAELKQAEAQFAALPAVRSPLADLKPEQRQEIEQWLGRVRQLRQVFAETPGQRVPEMQFLKDEDWMRVTKTNAMETDEDVRAAVAALRSEAVGYFARRISTAIAAYTRAMKAERPPNVQALIPYFDGPVDPTMLERYAVVDPPSSSGLRSTVTWVVVNKSPIDPDYDTRYQLVANGLTAGRGVMSWQPELRERYDAATRKYQRANPTRPAKGLDDFLPYFDPPLERDLADRLRKILPRP